MCQCNAAEEWQGAKCVTEQRGRRVDKKVECHRKEVREGRQDLREKMKRETIKGKWEDEEKGGEKGEMKEHNINEY